MAFGLNEREGKADGIWKATAARILGPASCLRVSALLFLIVLSLLNTAAALGQSGETVEDDFGILNPPDTGRDMLRRKLMLGDLDAVTCSLGFNNAKYDDLPLAREFARHCAEAGIAKAMTWMSYLELNGLGGPIDIEAAAEWDRRAAEAGAPVGMYNYGLDLITGTGVARDEALGRSYIDRAAGLGLAVAQELQAADYDTDTVSPDADDWQ